MLKSIVEAEGSSVRRIRGYTTTDLEKISDETLQRLGNRVAKEIGDGWKAVIEFVDEKRYISFVR